MNRMKTAVGMSVLVAAFGLVGVGGGCASSGSSSKAASAEQPTAAMAMFGKIKGLAGTWEMKDPEGKTQTTVYKVTAAGSAVCEQMFPGTDHEMVNMYHLDGDRVLVTHYCAGGNQPRMACSGQTSPTVITFEPESVTNLKSPGADHMAKLELIMPDAEHLTQKWTSMKDGKTTESVEFTLTRRKW